MNPPDVLAWRDGRIAALDQTALPHQVRVLDIGTVDELVEAITTLAIAPAAFLMGMPFPSGLRRLEHIHSPSVRWAWSLNAAASVLGSAAAVVLAIYLGLRATLLIGGALYLCAMGVIVATRRQAKSA